jgi:glycolate oxidase FAD binding subunit
MSSSYGTQQLEPTRIERTADVSSYANAVWRAVSAGEVIADYGAYHGGLGHAPPPDHVLIVPPGGVVAHAVGDLSITVLGGTTLGEIQGALLKAGQFLAVDGPMDMTIAEVVAHHVSGGLRVGHGSVRDLLLGLRYVDGTGQVITVGGRTVKNVAGYDVTRLMVGSMNILGLIAEVTLRTSVVPGCLIHVDVDAVDPKSFAMVGTELLVSDASPWSLEWEHLNTMAELRPNVLRFAFGGSQRQCDVQRAALERFLDERGWLGGNVSVRRVTVEEDLKVRAGRWGWRAKAGVVVKVVVEPANTGRMVEALFGLEAPPPMVHAMPTLGIVHFGAGWDAARAGRVDQWLAERVGGWCGFRVWMKRPAGAAHLVPIWPDQSDWTMLAKLKRTMDPRNMFNPGRLL